MLDSARQSDVFRTSSQTMTVKYKENTVEMASMYFPMFALDNTNKISKVIHQAALPMMVKANRKVWIILLATLRVKMRMWSCLIKTFQP